LSNLWPDLLGGGAGLDERALRRVVFAGRRRSGSVRKRFAIVFVCGWLLTLCRYLPPGFAACTATAGSEGVFSGPKSNIPWVSRNEKKEKLICLF
jgi:hypothetical protein